MPNLIVKQNDTWPTVKAVLEQLNEETGKKETIDLTTALKVTMIMKSTDGKTLLEGVCAITAPKAGKVEYAWQAGDTEVAALYNVEFEIEWSASKIETVPNSGYQQILIEADLGVS